MLLFLMKHTEFSGLDHYACRCCMQSGRHMFRTATTLPLLMSRQEILWITPLERHWKLFQRTQLLFEELPVHASLHLCNRILMHFMSDVYGI